MHIPMMIKIQKYDGPYQLFLCEFYENKFSKIYIYLKQKKKKQLF